MEPKKPYTLISLGALFATLFAGLCFVGSPTWLLGAATITAVAFLMDLLRYESKVLTLQH